MTEEELIKTAATVIRQASDYTITGEYYARTLAAAQLLADPGLKGRVDLTLRILDAFERAAAMAPHREVVAEIRAALVGGAR